MFFLKRLLLAACLSACSESAIAQETPHNELRWASPQGDGVKTAGGLVNTGKVYALGISTAPESAAYGTRIYQAERTLGANVDFALNGSQRVGTFGDLVAMG